MYHRTINAILFVTFLIIGKEAKAEGWSLEHCIAYAIENNIELKTKKIDSQLGVIEKKASIGEFIPEIRGTLGTDYFWKIPTEYYPGELIGKEAGTYVPISIGTPWNSNYTIQLSWKVLDLQAWENLKMHKKDISLKNGEERIQKHTLCGNVMGAYYHAQINNGNIILARANYENYNAIHRILIDKFQKGLTDKISLNKSTIILTKYRNYLIEKEIEYQKSIIELKFWMGYPPTEPLTILTNYSIPEYEYCENKKELFPNYENERLKIQIEESKLKIYKAALYPKINLYSEYSQSGFGDNFMQSLSKWYTGAYLGFRVQIPIFVYKNVNKISRQKKRIEKQRIKLENYNSKMQEKYILLELDMKKYEKIMQNEMETLKIAKENQLLSANKVKAGIIDLDNLQLIENDLISCMNNVSIAKLNYLKCYIEITYLQL